MISTSHLKALYELHLTGKWVPLETDGVIVANPRVILGNLVSAASYLGYIEMKSQRLDPLEDIFFLKWGQRDSTDNHYYVWKYGEYERRLMYSLALGNYNLTVPSPAWVIEILESSKAPEDLPTMITHIEEKLQSIGDNV